jgi:hypothetical protein
MCDSGLFDWVDVFRGQSGIKLDDRLTVWRRQGHESDELLRRAEATQRLRAPDASQMLSYGTLKLHPLWDPMRGNPRFEQIVQSLAPK